MGVSIVIPSFERPALLDNLLKSIAAQTYKSFEVIVVDDCSNNLEQINEVVTRYQIQMDIVLISNNERRGAPYSRNMGINKSRFELVALVDDDDEWGPLKLERQVSVFEASSRSLGLVYTWTQVINPERKILSNVQFKIEGNPKKEILESCFISSPSVMVRKEAIIDAGLFDESFPSCQDWDTWTRIIFKNYEVKVCQELLTYYLKHDGVTIGTSPRAKEGFVLYYQKHFFKLLRYGKFRHLVRLIRLKAGR